MTARDVIEQIKTLPPPERAKVVDFVHKMEAKESPIRAPDNQSFTEAAKWVFDEHAELMRKLGQ